MEDRIAAAPNELLGDNGLKLVERQFRLGGYIFDLLFEDRHGGKLIVEIQKGTLDRNHIYKILDYYHAYREKNPREFIDLMVVANVISYERKKRLHDLSIEYRELSESLFEREDHSATNGQGAQSELPERQSSIQETGHARAEELSAFEITPTMRRFLNDASFKDHFGFSGYRACIACVYARREGATQSEANDLAAKLGSTQKGYFNMLQQARDWGHKIYHWPGGSRGKNVYKLVYNPSNTARNPGEPPTDYLETNKIDSPPGVDVREWKRS